MNIKDMSEWRGGSKQRREKFSTAIQKLLGDYLEKNWDLIEGFAVESQELRVHVNMLATLQLDKRGSLGLKMDVRPPVYREESETPIRTK